MRIALLLYRHTRLRRVIRPRAKMDAILPGEAGAPNNANRARDCTGQHYASSRTSVCGCRCVRGSDGPYHFSCTSQSCQAATPTSGAFQADAATNAGRCHCLQYQLEGAQPHHLSPRLCPPPTSDNPSPISSPITAPRRHCKSSGQALAALLSPMVSPTLAANRHPNWWLPPS